MTVMAEAPADHTAVDDGGNTTVVPDYTRTEGARLAWAETEPAPVVERRPLPRALKLLLAGVCVGGLAMGSFMLGQHRTPDRAAPNPAPSKLQAPPSSPAAPVQPILDGTYKFDYRWSESSFQNTERADKIVNNPPTEWWVLSSSCMATGCVAVGKFLDQANHEIGSDPPIVVTLQLVDNVWSFAPPLMRHAKCVHSDLTGIQTIFVTLHPLPDGSFAGNFITRAETTECSDLGAAIVTPVIVTRVGPIPAALLAAH